ncbi:MAG TPA: PaaX family transcriptional regulator C-terminal domain-containing protein [Nakamurella sp.]|nr:PaaX family transcriptional regulator C-terminal domain-containing protein [Nakamurella sp.]
MSISSESLPPDRAGSPSSLIVTFAGCYLRQIGGWIAVADLIRLLCLVGVPEPAVRQSVLRLKSRGFLAAERRDGTAGYRLTRAGRDDLAPGDRRIFRYGRADLADGWVLAVFSVPEERRHHRHQLRSQLGWLGFGAVGAGVWAAPAALADPARQLLLQDGLDRYVTWFHARALDPVDVGAWWDLAALRRQYEAFLARWEHVAHADGRAGVPVAPGSEASVTGPAGSDAFAGYLQLVDSWRLFPRIDPGLPAELLPDDWPGPVAWQVFSTLRERWADAGLRYVAAVTGNQLEPPATDRPALTG